jgi:hypothetical protein
VVILGGVGIWYWMSNSNPATTYAPANSTNTTAQNTTQTKGTMYFAVTDAAANMGNVTAVNMTVDKVDVYSQTQGWVNVSQTPQTFSLLDLKAKGQAMLLAKADVPADTYTEMKLHVSNVMVTEAGKASQATMPSNTLDLTANVILNSNTNSTAMFDVMADKSLYKTSTGAFVFVPVVKFNSSNDATVSVDSNNIVMASGGNVDSSVTAGMDLNGALKLNFTLDPNAHLNITNGGAIQMNTTTNGQIKLGL